MRFLKNFFLMLSFLLLSVTSVYFLGVVFDTPSLVTAEKALVFSESNSSNQPKSETEQSEDVQSSSKSPSSSKEVAAASGGEVKGKIIRKTIGSDSANLKYNRVFVKNSTSKTIDLKAELIKGPSLQLADTEKPQVLIVHTHTTECYMSKAQDYYTDNDKTRSTKDSENIVSVGAVLKKGLEDKGIGVVHATEKHDYPEYSGSYDRAAETINKYLKKYPTIKVVIDLHRDSVTANDGTKTALTTKIKGKSAAQLMLVSGCQDGTVEGFPNWQENFRLAIKLQQSMEVMYPTLARPILFTARRYNQHLTKGSLLIECGTEANTLEEAKYSAELLANALASTLKLL